MKKQALSILCISSCSCAGPMQMSTQELAKRVLNQVVAIDYGMEGHGSGFFCYGPDTVCTAGHVVNSLDMLEKAEVIKRDGTKCEIISVTHGSDSDVAVLKVDCKVPSTGWLSGSVQPREGMPIMTAGHPLSSRFAVSFGHVMLVSEDAGSRMGDVFAFDATVNPGNSGGPIVTMDGELVGVVNAIRTRDGMFAGQAFGTRVAKIKAFLR